jgi:HD superfamily phosphohydrolase YqeK
MHVADPREAEYAGYLHDISADKIEWDQPGRPPYIKEILQELEKSIVHASVC